MWQKALSIVKALNHALFTFHLKEQEAVAGPSRADTASITLPQAVEKNMLDVAKQLLKSGVH